MVNTRIFLIYIMIVIFFNLFAGAFSLTNENDNEIEIQKSLFTIDIRNKIIDVTGADNFKVFSATITILALPFIILESLIFILSIIGMGFTVLPSIIEIILFTPLGIIIILDYIIPIIRGN